MTNDEIDARIDGALKSLTEPREDPAFRARVLSRLETMRSSRRAPWLPWVLGAATLSAVAVAVWSGGRPGGRDVAVRDPAREPVVEVRGSAAASEAPGAAVSRSEPRAEPEFRPTRIARHRARPDVVPARFEGQQEPEGVAPLQVPPLSVDALTIDALADREDFAPLLAPERLEIRPIAVEPIEPQRQP
jgi:hypothetical protein